MQRERIDQAVHAQIDRKISLLRDVVRSGGRDRWSHLFSHGHKFPTVKSAVVQGYLKEIRVYEYEITEDGKRCLDDIDSCQLRSH